MTEIAPHNHNNPPSDIELLEDNLTLRYAPLIAQTKEYIDEAKVIPKEFTEQAEADYISDRVTEIQVIRKALEAARVEEKNPFLRQGKYVDKFFNTEIEALDAAMLIVTRPLQSWMFKNAQKEKLKREQEAAQLARETASAVKDVQAAPTKENLDRAVAFHSVTAIAEKVAAVPLETMASAGGKHSTASLKKEWVGTVVEVASVELEKLRPYLTLAVLQVALNAYVKAGGRDCAGCNIVEEFRMKVK